MKIDAHRGLLKCVLPPKDKDSQPDLQRTQHGGCSKAGKVLSTAARAIGLPTIRSGASSKSSKIAAPRNADIQQLTTASQANKERVEETVRKIRLIHAKMKPRLDAHKEHVKNDQNRTQAYIANGLEPCDEVNECLNSLVTTCNEDYSAEQSRAIQKNLNDIASDLQEISNLSEGEMERIALDYIFTVFKNTSIPVLHAGLNNKDDKTAHLKKIVFDVPSSKKIAGVQESHQFSFPYLDNYDKMAENELRLLTKDSSIPDLKGKTISFVGAGFPLSAMMYHIHSGAKIQLVDIDQGACERAEAFLDICAEANIIDRSDFSVAQGDASKIRYVRKSTDDVGVQAAEDRAGASSDNAEVSELQSDILIFAAALPSEVKAAALNNISSRGLDVINRCTSETNNLLYPSTKLSALQKRYGLEGGSRVFSVEKVMYPEYAYRNKISINAAGVPVNKNGVPVIETNKINQNTAQKIGVAVNPASKGSLSKRLGNSLS
ncbi:hypothetical protein AVKW3434_06405 [Acidovorax sp. SUPP3434]|uniref:hypothetical protein n=1 Tax=Acidovorax sp. SUPP3434 TaxID=2920880 RepID=UPI0023DE2BC0|nr:hypothetical protein [Acidovorax sp. SUPP3434]GKS98991.1 hypothetical protein AVKW3434_06405 [Acidovorax sp. SUPP3434]